MKESIESNNSPLKEAFELLGASTPLELSNLYAEEDQKLMKSGEWDYNNPSLVVNKVKEILESIDPSELSKEELVWREEILWFWYHHAVSCAVWKYKDKEAAQEYAALALAFQSENHPNKITKLLYLLVNDQIAEAETWTETISESPERETAADLLRDYKGKGFFE